MISCNCGINTFKIIEREGKAAILCDGCGREILKVEKGALNLTGFETET